MRLVLQKRQHHPLVSRPGCFSDIENAHLVFGGALPHTPGFFRHRQIWVEACRGFPPALPVIVLNYSLIGHIPVLPSPLH